MNPHHYNSYALVLTICMIDIISSHRYSNYKYSDYGRDATTAAPAPAPTPAWDYDDTDEWADLFPTCGGTKQTPIDIDKYSVNLNCPITNTEEPTLKWTIFTTNDTFRLRNTNRDIKVRGVYDYDDFGISRGFLTLDSSDNTIARLRNNFVTPSGEHKQFCFDHIHWHTGIGEEGSEHRLNGVQFALEAHFVHFSCDYDTLSDALAAEPKDPYVLAVVGIFFEIGAENKFFERLIQFNQYLLDPSDDGTVQYEFNLKDLIPNKAADYYYYQGGLTTPPCLEVVQWHVLTDRMTLSERQLNYLRNYRNNDGDLLEPNWRPPQFNENEVYLCSAKDFKSKSGYKYSDDYGKKMPDRYRSKWGKKY